MREGLPGGDSVWAGVEAMNAVEFAVNYIDLISNTIMTEYKQALTRKSLFSKFDIKSRHT